MGTDIFFADTYPWCKYESELNLSDTLVDGGDRFNMAGSNWQEEVTNVETTLRTLRTDKTVKNNDDPNTQITHFQNSIGSNPIVKKKSVVTKKNINKQFFCPKCPRAYAYSCGLSQHLRYECGKPCKFSCPYCNKKTKLLGNCYRHIRFQHKGQPVYANQMY